MPGTRSIEVVGRERADRHERRRAERELARVAGQDVEAERREREDRGTESGSPRTQYCVRDERHDDERDREQQRDADAVLPDREDRWSCA